MKKVLSIVLAIAMIASMSAVAFAANTGSMLEDATTATGSSNHEVYGTYAIGTRTPMYKVDVEWGSMKFTYTESAETWNTTEHTWDLNAQDAVGTWAPAAADANKVTLTNHSSEQVVVTLAFADSIADEITGTWTNAEVTLAAPAEGADEGVEGSATLALEGKFTNEAAADAVIGTVTATIA